MLNSVMMSAVMLSVVMLGVDMLRVVTLGFRMVDVTVVNDSTLLTLTI